METALDAFGKRFIEVARDQVIAHWELILKGKIRAPVRQEFLAELRGITDPVAAVNLALPEIINSALFQFLQFIDEEGERLQVLWDEVNVSEASEQLNAEIFNESGWIKRFSKTRHGRSS